MQLSKSSELSIKLRQSKVCFKISLIIHIAAGYMVLQSSFTSFNIDCYILLLIIHFSHSCKNMVLDKNLIWLNYRGQAWYLQKPYQITEQFERMILVLDGGFFKVFKLSRFNKKKTFVIFHDQIELLQLKKLCILGKTNHV